MNKLEFFFLLITLFFCLQSCSKEEEAPVFIKGDIHDYYTNAPIPNYKIEIIKETNLLFSMMADYSIETIETDSLGQVICMFFAESKFYIEYHLLSEGNDEYVSFEHNIDKNEPVNEFSIGIKPYRYLNVNVKNTTGTYKYISNKGCCSKYEFLDNTFIIDNAVPEDTFTLRLYLWECDSCSRNYFEEKIYIENIDTTFITRDY
ncbi:MAG TPA: hypothetical protein DDX39_09630 [Bacteroidales bacterium]|nr:MAG: hypothetical protein A2W98_04125 [Bacteroidetes bacterium GWF2_33_38]OFY76079.1 MAG: hypothetical protein A2265_05905 [Bacteroidetes bacterium RIFOXYA12_FULL_33_9]OFY91154.1 MAG: hypothetical protein A2236_00625 [Bacteroidetes bacterium RIFOXYA2_FULL_33_7]HBF88889.1 hypothetical protein [Bacteroidales bacterium]